MTHNQARMDLLSLPIEIRWAIYSQLDIPPLHISHRGPHVVLSDCLTPNPYWGADGRDRSPTTPERTEEPWRRRFRSSEDVTEYWTTRNEESDAAWAKRLRSSWGPHWKCGAVPTTEACGIRQLLLVCKAAQRDIIDYMAKILTFHITDLGTINDLCRSQASSNTTTGFPESFLAHIGSNLRDLELTLRLPLQVFEAIDATEPQSSEVQTLVSSWKSAWRGIQDLPCLRLLSVEIDHTDVSSWSAVNERAILAPVLALATASPYLEMLVVLPHLHPYHETPDRHFINATPELGFRLHRRQRQIFHPGETPDGTCRVIKSRYDTFPVSVDLQVQLREFQWGVEPDPDYPSPEERQRLEDEERAKWKQGIDVLKLWKGVTEELFGLPVQPEEDLQFSHGLL